MTCRELGRTWLIAMIRNEGERLAAAAREDPERPVPRYPGWSLADLIAHTGSVHGRTRVILAEKRQEAVGRQYPAPAVEASSSALIDWFEEGLQHLCQVLEATDPSTQVWSISEDRTAGFWLVRMAIETALHRADAELAVGKAPWLEPRLAACAIDELARLYIPSLGEVSLGDTERTILLISEDRPERWLVSLSAAGAAMSRSDVDEADAVVRARASDLYLALTGRGEIGGLGTSGDPGAVRALTEAIDQIPEAKR